MIKYNYTCKMKYSTKICLFDGKVNEKIATDLSLFAYLSRLGWIGEIALEKSLEFLRMSAALLIVFWENLRARNCDRYMLGNDLTLKP